MTWKITGAPGTGDDLLYSQAGTPTLDLRFASSKTLNDNVSGQNLIDFTRGGNGVGTYVGSDGLIKNSVVNLLLRSEEFDNASWSKLNGVTVSANATTAPDGTATADKIIEPASTSGKPIAQALTVAANTTHTASIYFKAAERPTLLFHLRKSDYSTRFGGFFNTSTGVFTAENSTGGVLSSYDFSPVGNGWYRCSITGSIGANTSAVLTLYIVDSSNSVAYAGNGTSGIYLWGAQLEANVTTPGEYVKTTSSISGAPRFDHDPATGESLGLLIEESRTNLLLQSENFSTTWAKGSNTTITTNYEAAPDGTATADRVQMTADVGTFLTQSVSVVSGTTYTLSIYARATSGTSRIALQQGASNIQAWTVGTTWQRLSVQFTATATGSTTVGFDNDGSTMDCLIWGAQLEVGAFPTSYIPTTSAAVTRNADLASITGANFSSWYRQDEGTVFADAPSSRGPLVGFSDGTANERYRMSTGSKSLVLFGTSGGSVQFNTNTGTDSWISPEPGKGVLALKANDFYAVANGTYIATDTAGTVPVVNKLFVGSAQSGAYANGHISRLTYFDRRLPNATLQAITG